MTAGILHHLGVDMGNLRPPGEMNPKGYFEDKDMLQLHNDLLTYHGEHYHGFTVPKQIDIKGLEEKFGPRIFKILQNKKDRSKSKLWGWKATATGLFVALFIRYLDDPKILVVFRNPLDMAKSSNIYTQNKSALYDEISILEALELNLNYYSRIVQFMKKEQACNLLLLSYEDILNNKAEQTQRMADFLGLEINKRTKRRLEKYIGKDTKKGSFFKMPKSMRSRP